MYYLKSLVFLISVVSVVFTRFSYDFLKFFLLVSCNDLKDASSCNECPGGCGSAPKCKWINNKCETNKGSYNYINCEHGVRSWIQDPKF